MRVQAELDETKIVLHKTIDSLLVRGVKLCDLKAKKQVWPPRQK
jgi:synaptobrevin family protein YKT6